MKSDNETKWSEEDVDELLTTFFRAEVPARLDGPMPVAVSRPVQQPMHNVASNADSRWKLTALVGCAAALMLAVMLFPPGQNDGGNTGEGSVVVAPPENDDQPVNVNSTDNDGGDIAVPEQDIEIMD